MKKSTLLNVASVAGLTLLCACGMLDKKEESKSAATEQPLAQADVQENAAPAEAEATAVAQAEGQPAEATEAVKVAENDGCPTEDVPATDETTEQKA
jgi:hypothetical protein